MHKRYYSTIIITLVALSVVPVALTSSFFYNRFSERFLGHFAQSSVIMLEQVNHAVALILTEIDKMATVNNLDRDLEYFTANHFIKDPSRFNRLQDKLVTIQGVNEYLDSVYIIFERYKYFIYTGSRFNSELSGMHEPPTSGFFHIHEMENYPWFFTYKSRAAFQSNLVVFSKGGEKYVSIVKPIYNKLYEAVGATVYNINVKSLYRIVDLIAPANFEYVNIAYNGVSLSASPEKNKYSAVIDGESKKPLIDGVLNYYNTQDIDGVPYLVSSVISSTDHRWRFYAFMPVREYLKEITVFRNLMIIAGSVFILLLLLASAFLGNRIYRPIGKLVRQIGNYDVACPDYDDEISLIGNAFDSMLTVKQNMESFFDRNIETFRSTFLNSLLHGRDYSKEEIKEKIEFYKLDLNYDAFYVIMAAIDYLKAHGAESELSKRTRLIQLTAIARQLIAVHAVHGTVFETDGEFLCVVIGFDSHDEKAHVTLAAYAAELKDTISQGLLFSISLGVSATIADLSRLGDAYQQAYRALQHRFAIGRNTVIFHDEVAARADASALITLDSVKLANAVRMGHAEQIAEIVHRFMGIIHSSGLTDFETIQNTLLLGVGGTLLEMEKTGLHLDGESLKNDIFTKLHSYAVLEEAEAWMVEYFVALSASYMRSPLNNDADSRIELLERYIRDNFSRDISLGEMADHVQLNPAYLSKLFKDRTGKNISDYLNMLRIERSKPLLADPSMQIKSIAGMIGYNNTQSFNRFFKKYEGYAPDEYRKNKKVMHDTKK